MNKVSWESQKQQNVLKTLIALLRTPEKEDCILLILQSIKVFT